MTNLAGEHDSRQTGMALEQKLRAQILICVHEEVIATWDWHGSFESSQPTPSNTPPPTLPPNPSKTVPLNR